jgi:sodium transport system permease protein
MTLSNVKLILAKEVRDQLRDRRTLFMIAVLPIFLYPLLGMSLLQVAQFVQKQTARVLVVGTNDSIRKNDRGPALFKKQRFADNSDTARLLELQFGLDAKENSPSETRAKARELVQSGTFDAALYFPPDFSARLDASREAIRRRSEARASGDAAKQRVAPADVPSPEIIYNAASDKSQVAYARLAEVLSHWTDRIGDDNLRTSGVSTATMRPFLVGASDVASVKQRDGAMWSKILPVLLILWALTGAFYPAIDLCAGEKERGTLETLLSSPAQRSEIVLGKLITVMLFSIATAVLNLASMGITGHLVLTRMAGCGLPPVAAIAALCVALLPIAALFSALCVALAAFARSTKEGQYYLMPLLLLTMPLVILPMAPGVELNVGNSLIPVTGIVLLLRSVLEGNYWEAFIFSPIVGAVTLAACLMAIRWAVEQFNSEAVLFRESERLDLGLWVRRLLHDRLPTPTAAAAAVCALLILVVQFFVSFSLSTPTGLGGLARMFLVPQLLIITPPVLLMTFLFTSSPRETLLLKRPPLLAVSAAALLAMVLHPTANLLQELVQHLYPVGKDMAPMLMEVQRLLSGANVWLLLLLIAVVPAICEELAFRGFILSGFRHLGHKRRAIIISALLFGLTHGILQQSLIASLVGVVIGYIAVQSGSIVPCMVFHFCHNALAILNSRITPEMLPDWRVFRAFVVPGEVGGCTFTWPAIVSGLLAAFLLLSWFSRFSSEKSAEESLKEASSPFAPGVIARFGNDPA